ncbi:phytoene desaturase family protein [Derxia gummosa]|uniref:Phytoene desaturase family protein n=1 Tax=Derxia gummosa DSM 723 TaxID=1121388 RepID=A0A8B6X6E1_9BURK|nr:FAD-dependent oxidoreductase [Derxia gummosa]
MNLHDLRLPASVDAVVVGAGLGGLATAIRLRQLGLSVLVLERLDRIGGLCGTFQADDGLRYVIACNDFGKGLLGDLAELGIEHHFERSATRIVMPERDYRLPPDLRTVAGLLPHLGSILRYVRGLRRARTAPPASLAALVADCGITGRAADLLLLPAYLMGVSPEDFRVESLDDEFRFGYGYATPVTPAGGPQALADAFAHRLLALGGRILPGCAVRAIRREGRGHRVETALGAITAGIVVTTQPKPGHFPPDLRPGLGASVLLLSFDAAFRFPRGVHTHLHYPAGIRDWFGAIRDGHLPDDFGFHVFSSDLGDQGGLRTANVYFYLPEGRDQDPAMRRAAQNHVLGRLDRLLPGLSRHLRASQLVTPDEFRERHGLESRVTPLITPSGLGRPPNYSPETDLFHAGAAAWPPGEHAGAAVRSSRHVAELVRARLNGALNAA